jgi:hypothetical protein
MGRTFYILYRVLYGCETWYLTLRVEHSLKVFENKVLRRLFGPKRDEIMGDLRKLHNQELHNLYSFRNIIRIIKSTRMRVAGHAWGEKKNVFRILVGKTEGKI